MTLKEIDHFEKHSSVLNEYLFTFIGLSSYIKSPKELLRVHLINFVLVFAILMQILELYLLYKLEPEVQLRLIVKILQTFLPTICFSICYYYNLIHNYAKIKLIVNRIKRDWNELKDEHELITMKRYADKSRLWSMFIICCSYVYIISLIFPSMYNLIYVICVTDKTKFILPIRMDFWLENNKLYYAVFSLEFIIIFIVCTIGVANYSLFMSITQHAFALFNIVLVKLDRPFKKDLHSLKRKKIFTSQNMEYDWIITIIRSYEKAIRFVDLIKFVFGSTYLVEISLSLSFIIIDYLYIFTLKNTISDIISDSTYIIASLLMIYVYCYSGQMLINSNSAVFMKCCQVPFYMLSVKTQKILLILILQTTRPCNFSVRRIIVASHELFAKAEKLSRM
ncbi:odorant receptor 46a-like isoform X1 [Vespula squamosa]|uniref:Odorant receptor n=1 Tax=Vespula squamosa TaxID=30214 RepID=A0ABD2BQZ7_VESSQ